MQRPKVKLAQILYAMATVAFGLAFPFTAFWAIHAITLFLFLGNAVLILWLLAEGVPPFPRLARYAITVAHFTSIFASCCWIVSVGWKLQYEDPKTGIVVLHEHAIGILRNNSLNNRTGWSIARSQSNLVRLQPSGGWSQMGSSWESHQYLPLILPIALSASLLVLNYSTTCQGIIRFVVRKE